MTAQLIDGKIVAEKVRNAVAAAVAKLPGPPCLAVVLVGDDPASALYVKSKGEKTEAAGMRSITKRFPASATQAEIEAELMALSADSDVDGILLQLPLPKGLNEAQALACIDTAKDALVNSTYHDFHCWVFTPRSLLATSFSISCLTTWWSCLSSSTAFMSFSRLMDGWPLVRT